MSSNVTYAIFDILALTGFSSSWNYLRRSINVITVRQITWHPISTAF